MSDGKSFTADQVAAKVKNNRLRMTEAEVKTINPEGHRVFHTTHHVDEQSGETWTQEHPGPRKDGYYQWSNGYRTNDGNGNLTPIAKAMNRGCQEFNAAEQHRRSENDARVDRVALRADSGVQYVTPDREREAVERNGWRPRFRGRATRTYRGGRWYVRDCGEWREE